MSIKLRKSILLTTFAHTKSKYKKIMARTNLRKSIEAMEVGVTFRVPRGYEESSARNTASVVGKNLGRKYSVIKDVNTRTFTIVRNS